MRLHLLTYAPPNFAMQSKGLADGALVLGFDCARVHGPQDIEGTAFHQRNSAILEAARGAGAHGGARRRSWAHCSISADVTAGWRYIGPPMP